eukprot:6103557-Prymnesium_polylepis.1
MRTTASMRPRSAERSERNKACAARGRGATHRLFGLLGCCAEKSEQLVEGAFARASFGPLALRDACAGRRALVVAVALAQGLVGERLGGPLVLESFELRRVHCRPTCATSCSGGIPFSTKQAFNASWSFFAS